MDRFLWVALGGAIGSTARYAIALGALRWLGTAYPYGTLAVNLAGSFAIALVNQVGLSSTALSPSARLFLTTGVMGGLTTYSAFNYETTELFRRGAHALALANVLVTNGGCLLAGALGIAAGRRLVAG